jgi:hypothetical protein
MGKNLALWFVYSAVVSLFAGSTSLFPEGLDHGVPTRTLYVRIH